MSSAIDFNSTNETFTNDEENIVKKEEEKKVGSPPIAMDMKNDEEAIVTPSEQSVNIEKPEDNDGKADIPSELNIQTLIDQSFVLEGKRSRKPTLRLEMSESTPTKKEFSIPQGHGKPLGEIEYISHQISHASSDVLSRMRNICFGRRGSKATIRKHLRDFKGFEFESKSSEYQKHYNNLIKMRKDELRSISNILGLPLTGRNVDHAERILNFLIKPIDEGRKVPGKKPAARKIKKRSTHSKESVDTDIESKEEKPENGSDYHFKPGKKSSKKRSSDQTISNAHKRKKTPTKSDDNQVDHSSIDKIEIPTVNSTDEAI